MRYGARLSGKSASVARVKECIFWMLDTARLYVNITRLCSSALSNRVDRWRAESGGGRDEAGNLVDGYGGLKYIGGSGMPNR